MFSRIKFCCYSYPFYSLIAMILSWICLFIPQIYPVEILSFLKNFILFFVIIYFLNFQLIFCFLLLRNIFSVIHFHFIVIAQHLLYLYFYFVSVKFQKILIHNFLITQFLNLIFVININRSLGARMKQIFFRKIIYSSLMNFLNLNIEQANTKSQIIVYLFIFNYIYPVNWF